MPIYWQSISIFHQKSMKKYLNLARTNTSRPPYSCLEKIADLYFQSELQYSSCRCSPDFTKSCQLSGAQVELEITIRPYTNLQPTLDHLWRWFFRCSFTADLSYRTAQWSLATGWQLSGLWNKSSTCKGDKPDIGHFAQICHLIDTEASKFYAKTCVKLRQQLACNKTTRVLDSKSFISFARSIPFRERDKKGPVFVVFDYGGVCEKNIKDYEV